MIKKSLLLGFVLFLSVASQAQEIKVITIIESVVPMGAGRSRMIEEKSDIDYNNLTTERSDGKKSNSGDSKRKDAKVDKFAETKLLNFYSAVGINFQNVASNDAVISSKINEMISQGWSLTFVTSAVESDGGKGDGNGIFITRLFFSKK